MAMTEIKRCAAAAVGVIFMELNSFTHKKSRSRGCVCVYSIEDEINELENYEYMLHESNANVSLARTTTK